MTITKSVSCLESAAHRSATRSACSGVAHAFSAFSCRAIRRKPLRPLPRLRSAGLVWMYLGTASARIVASVDRASRAVRDA